MPQDWNTWHMPPALKYLPTYSWGINLTCAVKLNQHPKTSKPQYSTQNELPPREQWSSAINTLKNTYLMDFPPHNNPKYQLNCQNYKKHMFLLPPPVANEKHNFPMQSKIKWTTQSICSMTHDNTGTLMFKTLSKTSLQCTTIVPSVSPLIPNFVKNSLPVQLL